MDSEIVDSGAEGVETSLHLEEEKTSGKFGQQAMWFFFHSLVALASWAALMAIGYLLNPSGVPQTFILFMSVAIPLTVSLIVTRFCHDDTAPMVWLLGMVWLLVLSLWVLDLPTGPNQCFECDATEKLARTFFSLPKPSGLMDDDGPFIGTWPAAALLGYAVGARLAAHKRRGPEEAE